MKLYLSSFRIGNKPQELARAFGDNKKVAVIANSMDFLEDEGVRKSKVADESEALKQIGLEPEELDLRDYFGIPSELVEKLKSYGGVWVRGGNVFILRRAYKESGMDNWLKDHRNDEGFVYGGYSAGVCVLAPKMDGYEKVDDPNNVPQGYPKEVDREGVGLLTWAFAPHYMSPGHPETEAVNGLVDYFKQNNIEYKAISDGEVIIDEI